MKIRLLFFVVTWSVAMLLPLPADAGYFVCRAGSYGAGTVDVGDPEPIRAGDTGTSREGGSSRRAPPPLTCEFVRYRDDPGLSDPRIIQNHGVAIGNTNAGSASCDGSGPLGAPKTMGNPVVLATGNKVESELDFATSGQASLRLERTYNHLWKGAGLFGKHWISNFDYKLTFGTTNLDACYPRPGSGTCAIGTSQIIYAWRPDGRTIKFVRNSTDGIFYEDKPAPIATIQRRADGTFMHVAEDSTVEIYTASGHITSVKKYNVGWEYTYSGTWPQRVTHTSGRYVQFTWTNGQLTAVRDPAGNQYGFSYHANQFGTGLHRLAASSQPGSPATTITYHYEDARHPGALTGKSFNGVRYSKFTYSANGLATSSEHMGAEKHTFAYTPGPNGLSHTHVI